MNKIKLIYDVVKAMKEKEVFNGTLSVECQKDQVKVFSFVNEFEKNTANGQVKAKIRTEVDYEGRQMKHESNTEFNLQHCNGGSFQGAKKHWCCLHHNSEEGKGCQGIKAKLNKFALILKILNDIKVEELEDKSAIMSIDLSEIPGEMKKAIQERMEHGPIGENHKKIIVGQHNHCFIKELCTTKDAKIECQIKITKDKEIEKVELKIEGKHHGENNATHVLNAKIELCLTC